MASSVNRDDLVSRLIRVGELQVSGENPAEAESYFSPDFRFHGPDGFESDAAGVSRYFEAIRHAFEDRSIRRGVIVVEGATLACQTWMEGTFVREFVASPVGPLQPNGQRVVWDQLSIIRFDVAGRLLEEWLRSDGLSFLKQLGAR